LEHPLRALGNYGQEREGAQDVVWQQARYG
jgi:hypothetical protein